MKVFLDANILFSAAKSDGAVKELLRLLRRHGHECWADDYVIAEAQRNLAKKGPEATADLERLLSHMRIAPARTHATTTRETDWLPEKDRPVLAAAIASGCNALVTGDRTHFGAGYGKSFAGVAIHSPRSFAEAVLR